MSGGGPKRKARGTAWSWRPRPAAAPDVIIEQQGARIEELERALEGQQPLINTMGVANMQNAEDKAQLIKQLWGTADSYSELLRGLREANPVLSLILSASTQNTYYPTEERRAHHHFKEGLQLEGILANMMRMRSIHLVPFTTAAYSVLAERDKIPRHFTVPLVASHRGALMGQTWIDEFLPMAVAARELQEHAETIVGVECCMFDNFSMKTNYGALDRVQGGQGARLDVTNWCRMGVPQSLVPPGFNARQIFAGGIFRRLSRSAFCNLFRLNHPEILRNKEARWVLFFRQCEAGTMFSRPDYVSDWKAEFTYFEPIDGKLQSSYVDVEYELNKMRREIEERWPGCIFLFVGGDGLALMRMNHILNNDYFGYLFMTPVCIPIQGEAPHGLFHVLHAAWRMYASFIHVAMLKLGNDMYGAKLVDPTVKEFNKVRYLFFILVRACTEYCIMISKTQGATDIEDFSGFMAGAMRNEDFAWVVHFLNDAGFLVLQFQQSVRCNDSTALDLLWREFYGLAHNARANKTNYCPMAILRVYWGLCLVDPLRDLYRRIRTVPAGNHPGTNTGHDMPIENLNGAIRAHVTSNITYATIRTFVLAYSFLEHVARCMCVAVCVGMYRAWQSEPSPRDTEADVQLLLDWLIEVVGADWQRATRANQTGNPAVTSDRSRAPWLVQHDAMAQTAARAYHTQISDYIERLAQWQVWDP